jgi:HEXXH motif-containing protein
VLLHEITSLETAVLGCVSRIVPLLAKPDYDISHSEPRWDALVFVTIPEGEDHRVALRSLENIIHEAMHIQLTRLERRLPLIADETATMRSPWRDEPRHFRGILHGVYVFACIRKSLDHLAGHTALDESGRRYISSRVAQIGDEVSSIDLRRLSAGMTPEGRRFIERLLVMN